MNNKTVDLQSYLIAHADEFAQKWHEKQDSRPGSDYSLQAPQSVQTKITEQTAQYLRYIAQSLLQDEQEMKSTLSEWTSHTASERADSRTTIDEVIKSNKIFRKTMWEFVRSYTRETEHNITVEDVFQWEEKLNQSLDYTLESFTTQFMVLLFNRLSSQASLIKELSAPVITITQDVGLLPIIGDIDTERAKGLLESTLQQSVDSGINLLILDLSGVVMVDTMVAHQIFQLIDSLRLIGVRTILTGIRPEVAQTSVQLGLDFSGIQTESSLKNIFQKLSKDNAFI